MKRILARLLLVFFFISIVAPFVGQDNISKKESTINSWDVYEETQEEITTQNNDVVVIACETEVVAEEVVEETTTIEETTTQEITEEETTTIQEETTEELVAEATETIISTENTSTNPLSIRGYSYDEMQILFQIACAEAGDWDYQAVKNVVYVILNRVYSDEFPNSIEEVVFAKRQFSPISDGRYWSVVPNELVYNAVNEAVADYEDSYKCYGALYFSCNGVQLGEPLFTDSIGHTFFK